jgi:hypothetical protein
MGPPKRNHGTFVHKDMQSNELKMEGGMEKQRKVVEPGRV